MPVTSEQLLLLKQEMPYKMRQGPKGTQLAYIDARQVMDLLDDVCGPENWACEYKQVKDVVYCGLSINTEAGWVCKWDAGDESNIDAQKGEASDSFKRAAVRWGVGRFLYGLGQKKPTYTTPAAKPAAPVPTKPAAPEADPREAIKNRCEELGISGQDLSARLKELGYAWKTLTPEQGKTVLAKLGQDK